jgi:hypothetical protein
MQDAQAVQSPPACPCNGAVAACAVPDAGAAECTSTDLQGQTCETLGFTGGTLGCDASCSFDTSGCDSCVVGPNTACASLRVADGFLGRPSTDVAFALAASDAEIGLAWGDGNGTLHFTRLATDLSILADSCIATLSFDALSLASTSAGWMIGAHGYTVASGHQVFLYPLDQTGRARGSAQVLSVAKETSPFDPTSFTGGLTLASLPSGDRLLLGWTEYNHYDCFETNWPHLFFRLLTNDGGTVAGPDGGDGTMCPRMIGGSFGQSLPYSSVAVDNGFALEMEDRLSHVAFDGSIRTDTLGIFRNDVLAVRLAWSGSELRLLYQTRGAYSFAEASVEPGMGFLQRLSSAGALMGSPASIDPGPGNTLDYDTLLTTGPDSVVHVTQSANSRYVEDLVYLDSTGTPVLPPVPVVRANYSANLQSVSQGGNAIVAWVAPSNLRPTRIELARVRLAP